MAQRSNEPIKPAPKVNIAGDYTAGGIEIAPSDRNTGVGQSTLGGLETDREAKEAGKKLVNPVVNFPVDE